MPPPARAVARAVALDNDAPVVKEMGSGAPIKVTLMETVTLDPLFTKPSELIAKVLLSVCKATSIRLLAVPANSCTTPLKMAFLILFSPLVLTVRSNEVTPPEALKPTAPLRDIPAHVVDIDTAVVLTVTDREPPRLSPPSWGTPEPVTVPVRLPLNGMPVVLRPKVPVSEAPSRLKEGAKLIEKSEVVNATVTLPPMLAPATAGEKLNDFENGAILASMDAVVEKVLLICAAACAKVRLFDEAHPAVSRRPSISVEF